MGRGKPSGNGERTGKEGGKWAAREQEREREREAKDKRAIRFRDGWKRVRDGDEIRRDAQRFGWRDALHYSFLAGATCNRLNPVSGHATRHRHCQREVLIGFDTARSPDNVYWLRPLLVTYQLQLIQHRRRVRVIASSKHNDEIASPRSDRNIVRRISKLFHSSTNESFCKKSSLVKYT